MPMTPDLLDAAALGEGFMPDGEAWPCTPRVSTAAVRSVARDRHVLREVGGVPRRGCAGGRHRVLHRGSSPRFGGEPSRLGAPRRRGCRSRDRAHGHVAVLPAHDPPAGLEDVVVAIVGHSIPVARALAHTVGLPVIDGGHAEDVAMADYEEWSPNVAARRCARHPRRVRGSRHRRASAVPRVQRAAADGFTPESTTGSLRVLRK